ncbi:MULTISPECIES: HNH endonuclease [unclassified Pseudomonas]|uniref:HNH endonuclease n=1 Tax=unclassified Pseudomonas TaxID=196821 RepID=UPI00067F5980|nr:MULTISPECIES: HNH endonuclease [unclassified Pseudomonas]PXX72585.1 HNH endonuclease [Pseudomonas sp. LAIL14HWK12:I1]SOC95627.1 Restriction endonuclease [Pseudomonas sp. LAIL14HWK12:I3]
MAFSRPHSEESLGAADAIRRRISGTYSEYYGPDLLDFEQAIAVDEDFFKIAFKPAKWTLLHRFTSHYLWEEWNYLRKKAGEEYITAAHKLLDHYKINAIYLHDYNTPGHRDYILAQLSPALDIISHEVFCILFNDKELMRIFGERTASAFANVTASQHPNYLHSTGRMKRSNYWPAWLKEALFYRENGRCAKCSTNLTGVFDPSQKFQIDHIIPISNGGTTDPTNLQILCEKCNKEKSNLSNAAGEYIYVPWEFHPPHLL